ncbi:MAG: hypothetical protein GY835_24640 [bacterium]|nr:hypothetical protein [bacterium]
MPDIAERGKFVDETRPVRVKLVSVDGDRRAPDSWFAMADRCRQITNDARHFWLKWHLEREHDRALRAWREAYMLAIKEGVKKGDRPKCDVHPWPADFARELWAWLADRHSDVHSRVRTLLLQTLRGDWVKHAASNSAWKRWQRILFGDGEFPSGTRSLPIPVDFANCQFSEQPQADQHHSGWVKLWKGDKGAVKHELVLRTSGYRLGGIRSLVERIARDVRRRTFIRSVQTIENRAKRLGRSLSEEDTALVQRLNDDIGQITDVYKYCGSRLLWLTKGGWYLQLIFQRRRTLSDTLDADRVAYLSAGARRPIDFWTPSGSGGYHAEGLRWRGTWIDSELRKLAAQFTARQEHYKHHGSARRGHGRNKATKDWRNRLALRRRDVKTTVNHRITGDVTTCCIDRDCGRLVMIQPAEDYKKTRMLETAGSLYEQDPATRWDWGQMAAQLRQKCERAGIAFDIIQYAGGDVPVDKLPETVGAQTLAKYLQPETDERVES